MSYEVPSDFSKQVRPENKHIPKNPTNQTNKWHQQNKQTKITKGFPGYKTWVKFASWMKCTIKEEFWPWNDLGGEAVNTAGFGLFGGKVVYFWFNFLREGFRLS